VWRTHLAHTSDGNELRAVKFIADEVRSVLKQCFLNLVADFSLQAFRDDEGHATSHPGLHIQLPECIAVISTLRVDVVLVEQHLQHNPAEAIIQKVT
jgi:hypothetical protein